MSNDRREKFIALLHELFQLNQPELDFGLYRILHAKSAQLKQFIEEDLAAEIDSAFKGQQGKTAFQRLEETKRNVLEQLDENAFSADGKLKIEFHNTKAGKSYLEAAQALHEGGGPLSDEAQVYDHLLRFFSRYYDEGDFLSRRYHVAENDSRAAPYAVPYDGREVYLHWANKDQSYIKTTDYLTNFTFDLNAAIAKAKGEQPQSGLGFEGGGVSQVHFQIVEAAEGDHNNVNESEKRFFLIHTEAPIKLDGADLIVQFEYRSDADKSGQDRTWQKKRLDEAEKTVLSALKVLPEAKTFLEGLGFKAPTDKEPDRTLLAKYLTQYAARNTMDYFIHKDLGGFLRRELDFYIKNEIFHLDHVEEIESRQIADQLEKTRVLRRIARAIIGFLAQVENFQKSLWLKKKFVTEVHYCITLDRIPDSFYPEIAANERQAAVWEKLFLISEVRGYSSPLKASFLKENRFLVVDTSLFNPEFEARLIASFEDFDGGCNGVLANSENLQALRLLNATYREAVECIHIDPPYNTQTSGFLYRNSYQHSSWLAMMKERIDYASGFLTQSGSLLCHIDENEYERLKLLADDSGIPNGGTIVWDKRNPMLGRKGVATQHEYVMWRTRIEGSLYLRNANQRLIIETARQLVAKHGGVNKKSREAFAKWISTYPNLTGGERAYRLIEDDGRVYRGVAMGAPELRSDPKFHIPLIHPVTNKPCPVPGNGWSRTPETLRDLMEQNEILFGSDETVQPQRKVFLTEDSQRQVPSVIQDAGRGKADMDDLGLEFPYCHPLSLYVDLVGAAAPSAQAVVLDFFAGSGTNGHAVIALNHDEGANRRYVLVEVGSQFDAVLKPRILKAIYSRDWKDGRPLARDSGVSQAIKVIRLESYEDALNNLTLRADATRDAALAQNKTLRRDYLLHYVLDVETRGSNSLLNVDQFRDPTAYKLKVKCPGSDQSEERPVNLLETFNWLIGLHVQLLDRPRTFSAEFTRERDQELPDDQNTRLAVTGRLRESEGGPYWFRTVEGWIARKPGSDTDIEKVLVIWRKLTDDSDKDAAALEAFLGTKKVNLADTEFDTIYANGPLGLPLRGDAKTRIVSLEETFLARMWDTGEGPLASALE